MESNKLHNVDRLKTCPMLVQLFCREGGYHTVESFRSERTLPLEDEVIAYTWRDATLKELTLLIKEVHPDACKLNARFLFRLIFRSPEDGQLLTRELGKVSNNPNHAISHTPAPKRGNRVIADIPDPDRTLQDSDFIQGDYLDVAIYYSRNN